MEIAEVVRRCSGDQRQIARSVDPPGGADPVQPPIRDLTVAAPLKRRLTADPLQVTRIHELPGAAYPRPDGRGPIEAHQEVAEMDFWA